ncbi:hypothetical protein L3Q82_019604 [Scortum barcoo]|uniref:Uncharacterized protein n=1 Tax=Scortum barcoo TaxID=214431 RepID=A0ACB8VC48_9TELE|nr:hypothetical protein L3Q82_019604 [Scortum barcoo]
MKKTVTWKQRSARVYVATAGCCEFLASSVSFLGFIVSENQVKMDPEKVQVPLSYRSQNTKPDALSCLYDPELAAKEPRNLNPSYHLTMW